MFYIQKPSTARSLVACAIASISFAAIAQDAKPETPEDIAGPADPIVVTATRIPTRYNLLIPDVTVVDQEKIQDYSPAEQITDVLANQPGITVRQNGSLGSSTSVNIRGATGAQNILLIDGLRINAAGDGTQPWAFIPMPQIGRMEIVRGPTSSSYGSDAIGGVIQLFTRKGEGPMKFYADAGYGTYNTSSETVGVEGSVEGLSYSAYGSNTHSTGFPTYTASSSSYNPNASPYTNTSASGNLAYTIAAGQEIGVKALWGNGQAASTESNTSMWTNYSSMNVLSAYTKNKIIDEWTSLIRVGSTQNNSTFVYSNNGKYVANTTQKQAQWQNDLKLPIGNALLAYEFLNTSLVASEQYSGTSRNINSVQGGWNADVGNHLLQANIRNDNNSQFGNAVTGSVGYGYFIVPSLRGTVSWGTGFQAPTFDQLYYPGYADWMTGQIQYKGNPNLQPVKSQNTDIGLRYSDGEHSAGVVYYYNNIKNLIAYTSDLSTFENVGHANIQGVTTTYDGRIYGLNLFGSVDYQNAVNSDPAQAGTGNGQVLAFRPHVFGSLSVEKQMNRGKLGVQMQAQGNQQSAPGTVNNAAVAGYSIFNLYGDVKLYKDVSLFARLNNLFDRQYQTIVSKSADWGTFNQYRASGSNFFMGLRFDTR